MLAQLNENKRTHEVILQRHSRQFNEKKNTLETKLNQSNQEKYRQMKFLESLFVRKVSINRLVRSQKNLIKFHAEYAFRQATSCDGRG